MPDLLLELFSEEIPARMQRKAAGDLRKLVTDALVEAGLTYEGAREYWTPRRLTLDIRGVDARSKDQVEERKGPRTDAPDKAIEGFLRGAGIASLAEAHVHKDPRKGDFYVAHLRKPGRAAEEIVAEAMPAILSEFPWPKSMRWGTASARPGAFRWVRPLQSILCTFGPETSEPVVVDFEVGGVRSGNLTYGHRFHAPGAIRVRRFDDYAASLEKAYVVLDAERRRDIIRTDAEHLAFASGLEVVPDEALLEEVSGLVEWPVVLMGRFEEAFLAIPPEVVRLTIKTNQKCFVTRVAESEALSNTFLLVSNIEASDGGAEIARGNGKVVRARLSDALYFWETDQGDLPDWEALKPAAASLGLDLAKPLDQRMAKLDALGVTFHARLGTQGERVRRIAALAETIAPMVGADPALARRAALLAKADLTTEAVGEFPELQGLMGRTYAKLQGEHPSVQAAIEEHWKPQGPGDAVPSDPVAIAVALADKLDTLVGFWAIDEKPTGSKDPYALRRAALGVIRIVLERKLQLPLFARIRDHHRLLRDEVEQRRGQLPPDSRHGSFPSKNLDLLAFFHDRLKVQLRESGARHDLVDAVLSGDAAAPSSPYRDLLPAGEKNAVPSPSSPASAAGDEGGAIPRSFGERVDAGGSEQTGEGAVAPASHSDLLDITRRVEALGAFLATDDGRNLLAGTKRAENILAAEEKKGTRIAELVDPALFADPEEGALQAAVDGADGAVERAVAAEDYAGAMAALSALRAPVDAFFERVLVNAEDKAVRANRLALLARIRAATRRVADVSKIAG